MKEISIIIATFNAGQTLERCLNSIKCQKDTKVELLVIDGASKDNTNDIIEKHKDIIDVYVSEPDEGIYDAWNKGVMKSSGKWVVFLGADDYLVEDFFCYYLDYISSNDLSNVDIVSARSIVTNERGEVMYTCGEQYIWSVFKRRMNISHGSTLHNRRLFDEIGFFDINYKICGDYEFLLRKPLEARFCNKIMIFMQFGGMSNTLKGLKDSYRVRKNRKSVSYIMNALIFIKGCIGFYYRKFLKS